MTIIRAIVVILLTFNGASAGSLSDYDSAVSWFKDNREQLNSLVELLLAHPAIKRVDGELGLKFMTQYDELSKSDLEVYEVVLRESTDLGIKSAAVSREESQKNGDLISVQLLLISKGNVVRGYALTLEYIPDQKYLDMFKSHGIDYFQLDGADGWYLAEYVDE